MTLEPQPNDVSQENDANDPDSTPQKNRKAVFVVKKFVQRMLVIYLMVLIALGFFQRKILYHPWTAKNLSIAPFTSLNRIFPAAEDVEMSCADGVKIRGWFLRKSRPVAGASKPRPLVIYFHGNAGNRAGRGRWYQTLAIVETDVLAIDYHGYGDSKGKMTEDSLEADCDAAWSYATEELGYDPSEIIVGGTSLGGAAAVYLTAKQSTAGNPPSGMFLVSTFDSMVNLASRKFPWLPVAAVLVDRYPSDERMPNITCPILMMHGNRDRVIPDRFGKSLFQKAQQQSASGIPKKWVELDGAGHNNFLAVSSPLIQRELSAFVRRLR